MSAAYQLDLAPDARAILQRLKDRYGALRAAAAALLRQNVLTVSHIQAHHLSLPKHGKTSMLGLRAISTPGYRGTLHASPVGLAGDIVQSAIGSPIKANGFSYPALHEFGAEFTRTSKPGKVRLATDAAGNLLRQPKDSRLAVFAKNTRKQAKEVTYLGGRTYPVKVPARRPVQKGIEDRWNLYGPAVSQAIRDFWSASNSGPSVA